MCLRAAFVLLGILLDSPTAADPPPPPVFYETTTVTARPVSAASGAISVLDSREVEASAARSAADVLRQVPGLNALSNGSRAGVTNAFLRGGDPNYTLVLLDGVPLNDTTERQGGAVNLEELPSSLLDHVEVVRGPLTSFYGTSALAGVIQVFTPRGGAGPVGARLAAEVGNADLRRGLGRVSGPAGRGGWAAGASWDEEQHRIAKDRFRQLDAFANADLPLSPTTDLALTARFADGTIDDYPDASGGPVYGTGLVRHTDHRDLALGARLGFGDPGGRRHQVLVAFSRRVQDRLSPAVPPVVPASDESTAFTRLRAGWQVPLVRGARTTFDAGVSAEGEWGENASILMLPSFMGGDVPGDYSLRRSSGGAYAGARHERGALLYEGALRLDLASGGVLQANPHAGVVFRPGSGSTRLRASIGRASKLPSFFALGSPSALGGNPDLEPEHAWGGEAGIEHRFSRAGLELGAAYFLQEYSDLVDFDFDRFVHTNRARVRTQGVEMTARWRPHATSPAGRRGDLAGRPGPRERRDASALAEMDGGRTAHLAARARPSACGSRREPREATSTCSTRFPTATRSMATAFSAWRGPGALDADCPSVPVPTTSRARPTRRTSASPAPAARSGSAWAGIGEVRGRVSSSRSGSW